MPYNLSRSGLGTWLRSSALNDQPLNSPDGLETG
jgi:hypothetical protein